jgi:hypothetical protein
MKQISCCTACLCNIKRFITIFFDLDFSCMSLKNLIFFMFPRCDNDNKSIVPLEAEVIPVLHSVAGVNALVESDAVAKQEDEQTGIFQILDKLEEAVDALLNTSSSLLHPQLQVPVKTKQKPYECSLCTKSFSNKRDLEIHLRVHTREKPYSCSQCIKPFHAKQFEETCKSSHW